MNVGERIGAAIARGEALRAASSRRLRIRVTPYYGDDAGKGLTISATIASRHNGELEAQQGKGTRFVPWCDLDARAPELVGLVEAAVAEVEFAVASAPAPRPLPSGAANLSLGDLRAFEQFEESTARALVEVATAQIQTLSGQLDDSWCSEGVMNAALWLAALAAYRGRIEPADVRDELNQKLATNAERAAAFQASIDAIPVGRLQ